MSKLKKEKILKRLKGWKSKVQQRVQFYWYDDDEQAYQQIVALIKASFNLKNKSLMKLASDLGISFSAAKIISDHAQPEVTKEWYEEKAREIGNKIYKELEIDIPFKKGRCWKMTKDFIRSLVKEVVGK